MLDGWGYRSTSGSHHGLRRVLCEMLLLNRSPRLADLPPTRWLLCVGNPR
jgi:hypothetical protein